MERLAYVAGLFHDLGKYDPRFQERLNGASTRVDHSTAGGWMVREIGGTTHKLMAELVGYAVLGHHAGLPDRRSAEPGSFDIRLQTYTDTLDPVWKAELNPDLCDLKPPEIVKSAAGARDHLGFDLSVLTRFLFSALVDADFRDTEAFYVGLGERTADRDWPSLTCLLPEFRRKFDAHMAGMKPGGPVNPIRRQILDHVRANAGMAPGLYTLSVPTGGGKTLASLGFALDHAARYGHRRIIYAIPFTSVIDQAVTIFRQVLGAEHIIEHHSAIDQDERARRPGEPSTRDRMRLAMEDWAAPLVVTTNVQLFESLFAARASRARKLHNIAGSIIVLDEAQTIPRPVLKPCVRMIDTLARLLGCTIVLCTATQPALGRAGAYGRPGFPGGLDLEGRELAPDPARLAKQLRRCEIVRGGTMDDAMLVGALSQQPQALIIVNSRQHALELFRAAQAASLDGLAHLTTRQCAAHRRTVLEDARIRLKRGLPCRVVATSLIEAGVDVDFPKVWRAEAGWEQVMQAAGRCNREGKRPVGESIVTVFEAVDHPAPREIADLVADADRALRHHEDIQSLDAMEHYFREVYWRIDDRLDGRIAKEAVIPRLRFDPATGTDFCFRSIGADFKMIDSMMVPVIVPWDDSARKSVQDLSVPQIPSGALARKLQTYIVQVPPKARELLIRNGHADFACPKERGDQFVVLRMNSGKYMEETGLFWEDAVYLSEENTII